MPYAAGSVPALRAGLRAGGTPRRSLGTARDDAGVLFGIGGACLVVAATQNAWQMALALGLLGAFASIYHPVGIPMLVQATTRPGAVIGVNGLVGNLALPRPPC